jgi:subtilisin family serine protease
MKVLKHLLISGFIATFGISSVQAEITVADASQFQRPDDGTSRVRSSDIYVVQLKGDPAIAYSGDIAGYAATRPGRGEKLAVKSAAVKKYAGRLMTIQNDIMASVGAEKVYNYLYAFNGFAARMSASTAAELRKRSDVQNVWKDEILQLQTNTSPDWIGVSQTGGAWRKGYTGENVVVGVIDSGIWPEHPSFTHTRTPILGDYGPWLYLDDTLDDFYPSGCDFGNTAANPSDADYNCSRKLVTARCYNAAFSTADDPSNPCGGNGAFTNPDEFQSARGRDGHGSHVAATAAGNYGVKARIDGERLGRVSGIAPRARVAAYKVCWDGPDDSVRTDDGCGYADSSAAIDQAVYDGVDVINYSVGGSSTYFASPADIAYLFAADAGVFVATSNGNSGSAPQTTGTPAGVPWITAVGATQDDGVFYSAITVNAPAGLAGPYTAVEGSGDVSLADVGIISADVLLVDDGTGVSSDGCTTLNNDLTGKIALVIRGACSFTTKYDTAAAAGAVAIIVYNDGTSASRFDPFVMSAPGTTIPGFMIGYNDGTALANASGVNATMDPVNEISAANRIADFSSRGPNGGMPDVIKPDVSAPGVAILAAASPAQPSVNGNLFMSISGTSMASPHAAGAFALLKQKYPSWSAAQAKSALMTTGRQNLMKTFGNEPADAFDIGSGEILPTTALSPGLTFDADFFGYLAALCGEPNQAGIIDAGSCGFLEAIGYSLDPSDLNLASIGIAELVGSQTVTRTVTSVAEGKRYSTKTYKAVVDAPDGILVLLSDWELTLKGGESATYDVTFSTKRKAALNEWAFGSITWVEVGGDTQVRSTFAVRPVEFSYAFEVDATGASGSIDIPVQFGYDGAYSASVSGIESSYPIANQQVGVNGSNGYCLDFGPDPMTYLRFATFDDETTDPGNDDIDLDVYTVVGGDCDTGFLGSRFRALGPTSEESVSIYNPTARYWVVFVDGFAASNGSSIDYTLWLQPVWGDSGNTSVDAPASATLGAADTVTVDYSGLPAGRALGVLHHEDSNGEIGLTVLDVDAR